MEKRKLRLYGDPILFQKCENVKEITDEIEDIVLDMISFMKKFGGVGIAAPQVGELLKIMVISSEPELILINPTIKEKSNELVKSVEGCLSLPSIICEVDRPSWVEVEYMDIDGINQCKRLVETEALEFAHEFDHLEGKLIISYLTPVRKSLIQKKLKSIAKYNKLLTQVSQHEKNTFRSSPTQGKSESKDPSQDDGILEKRDN
jgi:peptide deformylase